ncbi:MAG: BamA/TamA family outer membrane protein [Gammaproteobacteria bacterium]
MPTEERLFIGTGIGLRYSTPIGLLRLDLGAPLDRRSDVDDIFQIYVPDLCQYRTGVLTLPLPRRGDAGPFGGPSACSDGRSWR